MENALFLRKCFCFDTLLSKYSVLLAGNLQKSYFVFHILLFLYKLTEFYKMCSSKKCRQALRIIIQNFIVKKQFLRNCSFCQGTFFSHNLYMHPLNCIVLYSNFKLVIHFKRHVIFATTEEQCLKILQLQYC